MFAPGRPSKGCACELVSVGGLVTGFPACLVALHAASMLVSAAELACMQLCVAAHRAGDQLYLHANDIGFGYVQVQLRAPLIARPPLPALMLDLVYGGCS